MELSVLLTFLLFLLGDHHDHDLELFDMFFFFQIIKLTTRDSLLSKLRSRGVHLGGCGEASVRIRSLPSSSSSFIINQVIIADIGIDILILIQV